MPNTERFTAATVANVEALTGLTIRALEGAEQFTALNTRVVKASLDEAVVISRAVLSAKDPGSLLTLQAGLVEPVADKAKAYAKQASGILTGVGADVGKIAGEYAAALQGAFVKLVEAAGRGAPEGSSNCMSMFRSAIETANSAFVGPHEAGHPAAEAIEPKSAAVSGAAVKSTTKRKRG
jgi:phasin family protein